MLVESAQRRLRSLLSELARIEQSDFAYSDSTEALALLRQYVEDQVRWLERLHRKSDQSVITAACRDALDCAKTYVPLLGFILRSSNVRNAFEVHRPLRRLARTLVDDPTFGLVLSSEWKYTPFTFAGVTAFPNFALIGLPAIESSNPLVLPIAGHEIGHHIWVRSKLEKQFSSRSSRVILDLVRRDPDLFCSTLGLSELGADEIATDISARAHWETCAKWCAKQAEETFCDLLGLRTFGAGYLHTLQYLLAPRFSGGRSPKYPTMSRRIETLLCAARMWGIEANRGYAEAFKDLDLDCSDGDRYRVRLADEALEVLVGELTEAATLVVDESGAPLPSIEEAERILGFFSKLIPPQNVRSLSDIINAAWLATHDEEFWSDKKLVQGDANVLDELVLKTIEVFDFEQSLAEDK